MHNLREALREAVVLLVENPEAKRLYDALEATVQVAKAHHPYVRLVADAAPLNAMLDIAPLYPRVLEKLVAITDLKRVKIGLLRLVPEKHEEFDKVGYMRQFMAQKRARLVRAAELENRQRPARDRLIGRARLDFMDRCAAEWKRGLDALFFKARNAQGRQLPKDIAETIRAQFWTSVDLRLDALEQNLRKRGL